MLASSLVESATLCFEAKDHGDPADEIAILPV